MPHGRTISQFRPIGVATLAIFIASLAAAQDNSLIPRPPFSFGQRSSGAYQPNRWGEILIAARNLTDEDAYLLSTSYFEPNANLQFGRRFWLPAKSQLQLSHPVMIPTMDQGSQLLEARTLLAHEGDHESRLIKQGFDSLQGDLSLRVDGGHPLNGLVDDDPQGDPHYIAEVDFLMTAEFEVNLKQFPNFMADRLLPARREAYDAYDQITLAGNRVANDAAGLAALRSWLFDGGRLWVMLDKVDPVVLEHLLGDEACCQIVDRVGLHEIQLEVASRGLPASTAAVHYDFPVEHVHVLAKGFEVTYLEDGWPVSMWKRCGRGELLVTTLAADGWVRPFDPDSDPNVTGRPTNFIGISPLGSLASRFFQPREESILAPASMESHVKGYVGYSVPSRRLVMGGLAGFTALLGVVGFLLSRLGRLEWMGLAVPLAALAFGGFLAQTKKGAGQISDKTALVQFIEPMADQVDISGTAGIFLSDDPEVNVHGTHDGWALLEMSGQENTARRLIWTDLTNWRWENLSPSPGLKFARFSTSSPLKHSLQTVQTLDGQGIVGQVTLPEGVVPSDGLLVGPSGRMAVNFGEEGRWTAAANRVLTDNDYLGASVLSDEQNRRLQTLKSLLARSSTAPPLGPSLLFWTQPWDMGMEFVKDAPVEGSALVAAPVSISRPAVGEQFVIPSPWLPYREAVGPDGAQPNGLFDNSHGVWAEKATPTSTWLRFQVPEQIDPLEIKSAHVALRVSGPVGKLEISGYDGEKLVPLQLWKDPIGALAVDIDPHSLAKDERGGLFLHVAGGDPDRPELTQSSKEGLNVSYWRIESLSLELQGLIPASPAPPSESSP